MNLTKFLNGYYAHFCMAPEGDGSGGSSAGAPASVSADTNSNASASATVSTTAGDAAKASGDQSSAAASVPAAIGTQAADTNAGANNDFRATWPDELKNDPSLKDFKDTATIAKALVDTKKLVGQKLGIPDANATPEAKAAFYEALGVPKDAAGYDFKAPDTLPEAMKASYDEKHAGKWAEIFKKHNVPAEAANAIRSAFFEEVATEIDGAKLEVEKSDKQFSEMATKIYGDNKTADAALQNVKVMVEKHVPAELRQAMNDLPNSALLIIASALSGETKHLTGEDKTISKDNGTTADGKTAAQLREEARSLQALPEYSSPFTPKGKQAHEDLVKKVKDIYSRIGTMG
jgi:hypothetical protein